MNEAIVTDQVKIEIKDEELRPLWFKNREGKLVIYLVPVDVYEAFEDVWALVGRHYSHIDTLIK